MRTRMFHSFFDALSMPDLSLKRLKQCEVMLTSAGTPALSRTSQTIEAVIRMEGRHYLLALPLTEEITHRLERTVSQLERLHSPALAPISILADELQWQTEAGEPFTASLLMQELPGEPFGEHYELLDPATLNRAIEQLREELERLHLAHNNLKMENLRWMNGTLTAIRPWHAQLGGDRALDNKMLDNLRIEGEEMATLSDDDCDYLTEQKFWIGHEFEGLTCFETEHGFGYRDATSETVIEPQFVWADDFYEGRAVVMTESGMGMIDRTGAFVIQPENEIVEYLREESLIRVRRNGMWAMFDITGTQTTLFEPIEEHELQLTQTK